jgi:hypothetical protein
MSRKNGERTNFDIVWTQLHFPLCCFLFRNMSINSQLYFLNVLNLSVWSRMKIGEYLPVLDWYSPVFVYSGLLLTGNGQYFLHGSTCWLVIKVSGSSTLVQLDLLSGHWGNAILGGSDTLPDINIRIIFSDPISNQIPFLLQRHPWLQDSVSNMVLPPM